MTSIKSVRTRVWKWTGPVVPPQANFCTNASLAPSVCKQAIDDWYARLVIGEVPFDVAHIWEKM